MRLLRFGIHCATLPELWSAEHSARAHGEIKATRAAGAEHPKRVALMGDAGAVLCVTVPALAAIGALYLLLYDGNERRRMVQRWRRNYRR